MNSQQQKTPRTSKFDNHIESYLNDNYGVYLQRFLLIFGSQSTSAMPDLVPFLAIFLLGPIVIASAIRNRRQSATPQLNISQVEAEETNISSTENSGSNTYFVAFLASIIIAVILGIHVIASGYNGLESGLKATLNPFPPSSPSSSSPSSISSTQCIPPSGRSLIGIYGTNMSEIYSRKIVTSSMDAQTLFDQGLLHLYGFNKIEARRNFNASLELDANCAMCLFGLAYSHGPNINERVTLEDAVLGRRYINEAIRIIRGYNFSDKTLDAIASREKDLIEVHSLRFSDNPEEWELLTQEFYDNKWAEGMQLLTRKYGISDPDISAMTAEAIINTSPWFYWNVSKTSSATWRDDSGNQDLPIPVNYSSPKLTSTLVDKIEPAYRILQAMVNDKANACNKHPLALHLYIHVMESSLRPQDALQQGKDLATEVMKSRAVGHLVHMPGHIFYRTGNYDDTVRTSLQAIQLDDFYTQKCLTPYVPLHNKALLVESALMTGQYQLALQHATATASQLPADSLLYVSALWPSPRELVHVRFGKWKNVKNVLDKEEGEVTFLGPYHEAISLYARALSLIGEMREYLLQSKWDANHRRMFEAAHKDKHDSYSAIVKTIGKLESAVARIPPESSDLPLVFFPFLRMNAKLMSLIVKVAWGLCKGEQPITLLHHLLQAVEIQDSYTYMEPEHFYMPMRHCLGALYVEAASSEKASQMRETLLKTAARVYSDDLQMHPRNGWSLKGLSVAIEELKKLLSDVEVENLIAQLVPQASKGDMDAISNMFRDAWKHSDTDVAISGSCCELGLC